MALSEKEQQLLAQMEAALAAEDPRLANALRGTGTRTLHRRGATLAIIGLLAGLGLLLAGMSWHWAISVAGFVVMLASTVLALRSWKLVPPTEHSVAPESDNHFMRGLDDKKRHPFDDGAA